MSVLPRCNASRRRWLGQALGGAAALGLPVLAHAAYLVRAWPEGKVVPGFGLADLDGKSWSLAGLKGQPVLLNFWASWCEPCRAEMPSLEQLAARHERAGLVVLAVNYQEAAPTIKHFLDRLPLSLPILLDRDGAATAAWTPRVFPTTVLIDRNGAPRHTVLGELDWMGPVARDLVEPLLARVKTV